MQYFPRPIVRLLLAAAAVFSSVVVLAHGDPRLKNSSRHDSAGWICIHLEGKPAEIGFQHGSLLAGEIDEAIRMEAMVMQKNTGRDWHFFRSASQRLYWNKIDGEYQEEMQGIVDGLESKGKHYDVFDIIALNANIELASYYVADLDEKKTPGAGNNKAPGNCSAFIATGAYTSDGKIVMGHNNWSDYLAGERWNIIADIVPSRGRRMYMDIFPGYIHSGDDFAMNSAGILITETTITQFKGYDEKGIPEFVRARRAEQYATTIDEFIKIMVTGNTGGYANDWLVGDIKTNEIARLELGLKNHPVWRSTDGIFFGSNFPLDPKLIKEETTFDSTDAHNSPNSRRARWDAVSKQYKGKIDAENGRLMEADTYNPVTKANEATRCVISGRVDTDPKGCPEWSWGPFYPGGTVQAKLTTAVMASKLQMWAHMGNPDGVDFIAKPFLIAHPEYAWQAAYLKDMKAYPWTLFSVR